MSIEFFVRRLQARGFSNELSLNVTREDGYPGISFRCRTNVQLLYDLYRNQL